MALKCVQGKSTIGTERSGYYNIWLSNQVRRSLRKKGVTNSRALNCNRRQCDVARDDMSSIKLLKYLFFLENCLLVLKWYIMNIIKNFKEIKLFWNKNSLCIRSHLLKWNDTTRHTHDLRLLFSVKRTNVMYAFVCFQRTCLHIGVIQCYYI